MTTERSELTTYPIKAHLDLVLLALEALTGVGSDGVLQVAEALGLQDLLGDRVTLWRLRQSSPLRKGKGGRKKLDLDEAQALVLVSCHLAQQHGDRIRGAIAHLEKCGDKSAALHKNPILGDYLERFENFYQERIAPDKLTENITEKFSDQTPGLPGSQRMALKLLVDLLFYSAPTGSRRLWLALLEREL